MQLNQRLVRVIFLFFCLHFICYAGTTCALVSGQTVRDSVLESLWRQSCAHMEDTLVGAQIRAHLVDTLRVSGTISLPLPSLPGLRDILSSDGRLRLLVWSHRTPLFEIFYMGVVAWLDGGDSLRVSPLHDARMPVGLGLIDDAWLMETRTPSTWFGASYYDVCPFMWQGQRAYVLLGVAGSTPLVARRVVETLLVTAEGDLQFGIPCIAYRRQRLQRLLFSHGARVAMTLHLIDPKGRILIDHLSPSRPQYSGLPQYYGPDFSQDDLTLGPYGDWVYGFDVIVTPPSE